MSTGIVDTTVLVHHLRKHLGLDRLPNRAAVHRDHFLAGNNGGARNQVHQAHSRQLLEKFELLTLTMTDQQWALEQLERLHFSHRVGMNDCLIAAVAHRLQSTALYSQSTPQARSCG